jgi:glycyl-tRNA synthetase beta chain
LADANERRELISKRTEELAAAGRHRHRAAPARRSDRAGRMAGAAGVLVRGAFPRRAAGSPDHHHAGQPEVLLPAGRRRQLLPRFITVANIESKDPQQIIAGNEKVVRRA